MKSRGMTPTAQAVADFRVLHFKKLISLLHDEAPLMLSVKGVASEEVTEGRRDMILELFNNVVVETAINIR
jgi:hypothetical protein